MSSDCDEEEGREQRNQGDDAMKRAHQERTQETLRHEPDGRRPVTSSQLRASEISRQYGFTSRYWIRMAAAGRVPGARQPSGVGGAWLFDARLFAGELSRNLGDND
jgi:hypothetical protein